MILRNNWGMHLCFQHVIQLMVSQNHEEIFKMPKNKNSSNYDSKLKHDLSTH